MSNQTKLAWLSLTAVLGIGIVAQAAVVDQDTAMSAASGFLSNSSVAKRVLAGCSVENVEQRGSLWIVHLAPSGYIEVAGSTKCAPILSFSSQDFTEPEVGSPFDAKLTGDSMMVAEKEADESLEDNADWVKYTTPVAKKRMLLASAPSGTTGVVGPLMNCGWGQGAPFNDLSPLSSLCGCMATAAGQEHRYWRWPYRYEKSRQGTHGLRNSLGEYSEHILRPDGRVPFNYDKVVAYAPNPSSTPQATDKEATYQTAWLSLWMQSLTGMGYKPGGSGGTIKLCTNAEDYWFEKGPVMNYWRDGYTNLWTAITNDLARGIPIQVNSPGHQMVADGFAIDDAGTDSEVDWININYGWGSPGGWNNFETAILDSTPGGRLADFQIGYRPQKIVQFEPVPKVCTSDVTLKWHIAPCYTNQTTGFTLVISGGTSSSSSVNISTHEETTTYTATGLETGYEYTFTVTPVMADGSEARSNSATTTIGTPAAAPEITSISSVAGGLELVQQGFYIECARGIVNDIAVTCSASTTSLEAYPSHTTVLPDEDVSVTKSGNIFTVHLDATDMDSQWNGEMLILTLVAKNSDGTEAYKNLMLRFNGMRQVLDGTFDVVETNPTTPVWYCGTTTLDAKGQNITFGANAFQGNGCNVTLTDSVGGGSFTFAGLDGFLGTLHITSAVDVNLPNDMSGFSGTLAYDRCYNNNSFHYTLSRDLPATATVYLPQYTMLYLDNVTVDATITGSGDVYIVTGNSTLNNTSGFSGTVAIGDFDNSGSLTLNAGEEPGVSIWNGTLYLTLSRAQVAYGYSTTQIKELESFTGSKVIFLDEAGTELARWTSAQTTYSIASTANTWTPNELGTGNFWDESRWSQGLPSAGDYVIFSDTFGGTEMTLNLSSDLNLGYVKVIGTRFTIKSSGSGNLTVDTLENTIPTKLATTNIVPTTVIPRGKLFVQTGLTISCDIDSSLAQNLRDISDAMSALIWDDGDDYCVWRGTVVFKDYTAAYLDLTSWGHSRSFVRFNGVTGHLTSNKTYDVPVELVDNGDTVALNWNNGSSGATDTFAKIFGSGTFKTTAGGGNNENILVKDSSEFTGSFQLAAKNVIFGSAVPSNDIGTGGRLHILTNATIATGAIWNINGGVYLGGSCDLDIYGQLWSTTTAITTYADDVVVTLEDNAVIKVSHALAGDYAPTLNFKAGTYQIGTNIRETKTVNFCAAAGKYTTLDANGHKLTLGPGFFTGSGDVYLTSSASGGSVVIEGIPATYTGTIYADISCTVTLSGPQRGGTLNISDLIVATSSANVGTVTVGSGATLSLTISRDEESAGYTTSGITLVDGGELEFRSSSGTTLAVKTEADAVNGNYTIEGDSEVSLDPLLSYEFNGNMVSTGTDTDATLKIYSGTASYYENEQLYTKSVPYINKEFAMPDDDWTLTMRCVMPANNSEKATIAIMFGRSGGDQFGLVSGTTENTVALATKTALIGEAVEVENATSELHIYTIVKTSGNVKLYVDGVLKVDSDTTVSGLAPRFQIGSVFQGNSSSHAACTDSTSRIDFMRFYDFAMSASYVANLDLWEYVVIDEGEKTANLRLKAGATPVGNITLPAAINGYAITTIPYPGINSQAGVTGLTIPASVTNIGAYAFWNCTALASVTMLGDAPAVGADAFSGVAEGCVVHLPRGNTTYEVVDGKWQGMAVEYYGDEPEPEPEPEYEGPAPIAVWVAGEFDDDKSAHGGLEFALNGNTTNAVGEIVIGNSTTLGATVAVPTGTLPRMTMLVKYSVPAGGAPVAQSVPASLFSTYDLGARAAQAASSALDGYWYNGSSVQAGTYAFSNPAQTMPQEGYVLISNWTTTPNSGDHGTAVYSGETLSELVGGEVTGLRFTGADKSITAIGVGGPTVAGAKPWQGMVIKSVALFDDWVATNVIANYKFPAQGAVQPEDSDRYVVEPVASWVNDFKTTTKGDYSLSVSGTTAAKDDTFGGTLTIGDAAAIIDTTAANSTKMTVLVKYRAASSVVSAPVVAFGGMAAVGLDVGVYTKSDKTLAVYRNFSTDNTKPYDFGTAPQLSATGGYVLCARDNGQQCMAYVGDSLDAMTGGTVSDGGIKFSNITLTKLGIGGNSGMAANANNMVPFAGLEIEKIVVFDGYYTPDQIRYIPNPEDGDTVNISDNTTWTFTASDTPREYLNVGTLSSSGTIAIANASELTEGTYPLATWTTPQQYTTQCAGYGKVGTLVTDGLAEGLSARLIYGARGIYLRVDDTAKQAARKPLVVWCYGDSITEGFNAQATGANYRILLYQKLEMLGYNVRSTGVYGLSNGYNSVDPTGTPLTDQYKWHSAKHGATAGPTTLAHRSNLSENVDTLAIQAGTPDVALLLIGVNDLPQFSTVEPVFAAWTNIVGRLVKNLPDTKIIVSTVLYSDGTRTDIDPKIANLNTNYIKPIMAAQPEEWQGHVFLADLNSYVKSGETGIIYSDHLHPDWWGYDQMADGYLDKIVECYPDPDATNFPSQNPIPAAPTSDQLGAANKPELADYRDGFKKLCNIRIEKGQDVSNVVYDDVNNDAASDNLEKVGYFVEFVRDDNHAHKWVWVDMDAFGDADLASVGLPQRNYQQAVTKMHVCSNHGAIDNVAADDDSVTGWIEFSPYDYTRTGSNSAAPANYGEPFDWNDTLSESGSYGCMQVFRVMNPSSRDLYERPQLMFAFNNFQSQNSNPADFGIGNFAQHFNCNNSYHTEDWTGVGGTLAKMAPDQYSVKTIEIWTKEAVYSGPEPAAVWVAGEFDDDRSAHGGCEFALNDNTIDGSGNIVIGNSTTLGATIAVPNYDNATMLVKYEIPSGGAPAANSVPASMFVTKEMGALAGSGSSALDGYWLNGSTVTAGYAFSSSAPSIPQEGYLLISVPANSNQNPGNHYTAAYVGETVSALSGGETSGLRFTGDNNRVTSIGVGGPTVAGAVPWAGMVIKGVALFDSWLTPDDIRGYKFPEQGAVQPEDSDRYNIEPVASWVNDFKTTEKGDCTLSVSGTTAVKDDAFGGVLSVGDSAAVIDTASAEALTVLVKYRSAPAVQSAPVVTFGGQAAVTFDSGICTDTSVDRQLAAYYSFVYGGRKRGIYAVGGNPTLSSGGGYLVCARKTDACLAYVGDSLDNMTGGECTTGMQISNSTLRKIGIGGQTELSNNDANMVPFTGFVVEKVVVFNSYYTPDQIRYVENPEDGDTVNIADNTTWKFAATDTPREYTNIGTLSSSGTIAITNSTELTEGVYPLATWTTAQKKSTGYGHVGTLDTTGLPAGLSAELVYGAKAIYLRVWNPTTQAAKGTIKVWPYGDSITEGFNAGGTRANYRVLLAQKLSMLGFNVEMVGCYDKINNAEGIDPSGQAIPDAWKWHSAKHGATAGPTTSAAGRANLCENVDTLCAQAGNPDVVLLFAGANDIVPATGLTATQVVASVTNIVAHIATNLPDTKIVVGNQINVEQGYNSGNYTHVTNMIPQVNALLKDYVDNLPEALVGKVFLADLNSYVKSGEYGILFDHGSDHLHPDWWGHNQMAEGWLSVVTNQFTSTQTFPSATIPAAPTTEELGAAAKTELEAYRQGFKLARRIDATSNLNTANPYAATGYGVTNNLEKVAYFVEYVRADNNAHKWVWVDMDAFGNTIGDVGLPTTNHQQVVTKLHVKSNHNGIENVAANDDTVTGFIEFSPYDYIGNVSGVSGAPAGNGSCCDWNDTLSESGSYSCMQVHRVFSPAKAAADGITRGGQVLFAYNNWQSSSSTAEFGIGNFSSHFYRGASDAQTLDYTYTANAPKMNADAYSVKRIEIWTKQTAPTTDDTDSEIEEQADNSYTVKVQAENVTITVPEGVTVSEVVVSTNTTTVTGIDLTGDNAPVLKLAVSWGEGDNQKATYDIVSADTDGKIILDPEATVAVSTNAVMECGSAEIEVKTIPGLFYGIAVSDSLEDDFTAQGTPEQATGSNMSLDVATIDPNPGSAKYFKVTTSASANGAKVESKTYGVMKPAVSSGTNELTIVSVPWKGVGQSGDEVPVSQVIKTSELNEGDELYVYGSDGKYKVWTLQSDKTWEGLEVEQVSATSVTNTKETEAKDVMVSRGSGFWVKRKNTNSKIVMLGEVVDSAGSETKTIVAGTKDTPKFQLCASPKAEAFDLNVEGKITGTIEPTTDFANPGDVIQIPMSKGIPKVYYYHNGAWKRYTSTGWSDSATVPMGTGFWYISRGGYPTINW